MAADRIHKREENRNKSFHELGSQKISSLKAEEEERKSCSVLRGEKGDDGVSDGLGERGGEDNAQNGERPRTLVISHTVMRKRGRGKWRGKEEFS